LYQPFDQVNDVYGEETMTMYPMIANQQCTMVEIQDLSDDAPEYASKLKQQISLFGGAFNVYAQKNVKPEKVLHVANVMASLLDADYDGEIDNWSFKETFVEYQAHVAIFSEKDNSAHEHYNEHVQYDSQYSPDLFLIENEINEYNLGILAVDKTLEVMLKQLYQNGFYGAHNNFKNVFDSAPYEGNFNPMNRAMNEAKDTTQTWPLNAQQNVQYSDKASYRPTNEKCDYMCQNEEYFMFASMAMMGTLQDSRNARHHSRNIFLSNIANQAEKNNQAILKHQPIMHALLTDLEHEHYGTALKALNQYPKSYTNQYRAACYIVTEPAPTEPTTTETTTTASPWNEDVCKSDEFKVNYWMKSNRGKKVLRAGENTFLIRLKMSRAPETSHYTIFLTWGKKNCGADFIDKLGNGGVRIDLMDKSAEYKFVGKFTGQESKHYNTVFQFENQAVECSNCIGSSTDQMEMIVHFIDTVEWGTKDPATCLGTLRAGYMGEYREPEHSPVDVSPCVSWVQKFW